MTRMTGPDCVVMCNLINTHTHTHRHKRLGVTQVDMMRDSLWRKTFYRSLGWHDAAESADRICHGNDRWQETTRLHAMFFIKTG